MITMGNEYTHISKINFFFSVEGQKIDFNIPKIAFRKPKIIVGFQNKSACYFLFLGSKGYFLTSAQDVYEDGPKLRTG